MNYFDERPSAGLTIRQFTKPDRLIFVSTYVTRDLSFGKPGIMSTCVRYLDEYGRQGSIKYDGVIHISQAEHIARSNTKSRPFMIWLKDKIKEYKNDNNKG